MRHWIAVAAAVAFAMGLVPIVQHRARAGDAAGVVRSAAMVPGGLSKGIGATRPADNQADGGSSASAALALSAALPSSGTVPLAASSAGLTPSLNLKVPLSLAGIDLTKIALHDDGATAPGPQGRVAHLTIDPDLQRTTKKILRDFAIPEAAVVLLDVNEGKALVWASHVQQGPLRDLCVEATAPAASVFKIVTAAALVENAGLLPDTKQCYAGGESRILSIDLVDDPKRDHWCATLAEAMGRSLNTVFARLATKKLTPPELTTMAGAFGFGESLPFDVPVAVSEQHIPEDKLGFARTAAGFWNSTMSPIEGAMIASTVANRGETLRPTLVQSVTDASGTLYEAPKRASSKRTVRPETAAALATMMEATTVSGTSHRAFHDLEGRAFLPNISVAGKTGSLSRGETQQFYTWFVGFAPSRAPEVAVSVLAVNTPTWRAKANVVAREVLRAYFASKGAAGVTRP